MQGSGGARVGKGKKGGRDGEKGKKEGGRERWMEKKERERGYSPYQS